VVIIEFTNPNAVVLRTTLDAFLIKYNALCGELGKGQYTFYG
jgi:hypothetical protein